MIAVVNADLAILMWSVVGGVAALDSVWKRRRRWLGWLGTPKVWMEGDQR